ncbi:MAG: hypothetical protein MJ210_01585 [Alphaproteobacteria bacterium]|nr:hypothetical protein [Alphaproteobacteria bacterium]
MFGKKNRTDDDLRSKGFIKWINKAFRFLLFPFIHPWVFGGLLVILVAIAAGFPIYYGISFNEAPSWWGQKISSYYQQTEKVVSDQLVRPVQQKINELRENAEGSLAKTDKKMPSKVKMVAYETPKMSNRRAFAKAQEVPVDVKATLENQKKFSAKSEAVAQKTVSDQQQSEQAVEKPVLFNRIAGLDLVYETVPYKLSGTVKVINANELAVNGTVVFLYGIYSAPSSQSGIQGKNYLQDNINGKNVDCWVGAKTKDGLLTAVCFYNGININQRLVDLKYSKNVGLN